MQYVACWLLSSFSFVFGGREGGGWCNSIPIILVGRALQSFFLQVSAAFSLLWGGAGMRMRILLIWGCGLGRCERGEMVMGWVEEVEEEG